MPKRGGVTAAVLARPLRALLALVAVVACTAQQPAGSSAAWCTKLPFPKACRVYEIKAGNTILRLAVAATDAQRERGLMNVSYVPSGQGMIFAFPGGDEERYFWMKDTITPLDMVFVKSDGTISAIAVNVPATKPKTPDDKVARRDGLGKYVIELGAGDAARIGLLPGMQLYVQPVQAQ